MMSEDPLPEQDYVAHAAALLVRLRENAPRVHCITNAAAQVFTANLLLAAGAIPSLTVAAEEVPFFVERSAALLINLGTLDAERRAAIPVAIAAAQAHKKPWILDPVFVESSPPRLVLARALEGHHPTILRCNAAEFEALSGVSSNATNLAAYARKTQRVIALTGATDHVTDGARMVLIANGHPLMRQVTAMGCAGTALIGAFAANEQEPLMAAAAGLLIVGVAGDIAAARAEGPGSFVSAFLDTLAALTPDDVAEKAKLSFASNAPIGHAS